MIDYFELKDPVMRDFYRGHHLPLVTATRLELDKMPFSTYDFDVFLKVENGGDISYFKYKTTVSAEGRMISLYERAILQVLRNSVAGRHANITEAFVYQTRKPYRVKPAAQWDVEQV